jgi:hypothetical protein
MTTNQATQQVQDLTKELIQAVGVWRNLGHNRAGENWSALLYSCAQDELVMAYDAYEKALKQLHEPSA